VSAAWWTCLNLAHALEGNPDVADAARRPTGPIATAIREALRIAKHDLQEVLSRRDQVGLELHGRPHGGPGFAELVRTLDRLAGEADPLGAAPELCRVGVAVLLIRHSRGLLIGRRIGSYGGGEWHVPGGKLEKGETPLECAERELREETGIGAKLQMLPYASWDGGHPDHPDYVTLWAIGYAPDGAEPQVMEPEKCERWTWCPSADRLPEPVFRCLATARRSGLLDMAASVDDERLALAAAALGRLGR
jgi:8-oxo-dGTP diphosphatase